MSDSGYDSQIEKISAMMIQDKLSPDEQDPKKLEKYHNYAKTNFNLNDESALQLVYESLLYLKLKSNDDFDPLQKGDNFGAGFS